MRVLVTRPIEDAKETERVLREHGHEAFIEPLLEVIFFDGPQIQLTATQAILATSANGVRALSRRTSRRDLPLFAVGPQTAESARAAGFTSVRSADGDATALAHAVANWTTPEKGPLLHVSGAEGEGRLAKALSASGFVVRTEYLYEVRPVSGLSVAVGDALKGASLDAVLLFSPRSAGVFRDLVQHTGLGTHASKLIGVCISDAAAAALAPLKLLEVRVAKRPNQSALLDCLG